MMTAPSLSAISGVDCNTAVRNLTSNINGLSESEVLKRQKLWGKNELTEQKKKHILLEFLGTFKNPLVLTLIVAAALSFTVNQPVDGTIILAIVAVSAVLNFTQEFKADRAAAKLKERVAFKTSVIRNGVEHEIASTELVPGDIVSLHSGELIPADIRILTAKDFFVNQSALTGESFPVEKHEKAITVQSGLPDLHNIGLSGSSVITGTAKGLVINTGKRTEFGKIAEQIESTPIEGEFTKGIKQFSFLILRTTIFFVLFVFLFNTVFKQTDLFTSFTFAVAIAVGLTPELLPMILSVTMSRGSVNMAKHGVIVKKLTSIPNLGSMDILCTDKTGTLTKDHIELVKYTDMFGKHSETVFIHTYINSCYQSGIKNPMDEAVISYKKVPNHGYTKIDEIPFDFVRKRMSVVAEKHNQRFLITKGAPEEIFRCSTQVMRENHIHPFTSEIREKATKQYQQLSADGFRVLAVARKPISSHTDIYSVKDEHAMELLGFIAFLDPPKPDVSKVIQQLNTMGVTVKVITGDNELVAEKICREVGLPVKGTLLGHELDHLTDDALRIVVEKTTLFARFAPDEKNRVISALKMNGHVVGYLGDGINDAASLQNADVGLSVENAVDVAKESADMILTNKSLAVLKDGIISGRKTFANTLKYTMMGVSSNFGNMFSVLGAVLFLPFLPMLPMQILLNNLLYDISQITIPGDTVDAEDINQPRRWNMPFLRNFMIVFGSISSVFDFITFFVLYRLFHLSQSGFQTGWFLESLATQTLVIYIIRTKKIPFIQSAPEPTLFFSTIVAVAVGWLLPFTGLGKLFGFTPLTPLVFTTLIGIVITYLCCVEVVKRYFFTSLKSR